MSLHGPCFALVAFAACITSGLGDEDIPNSVLLARIEALERQGKEQQLLLSKQNSQIELQNEKIAAQENLIRELLEWKQVHARKEKSPEQHDEQVDTRGTIVMKESGNSVTGKGPTRVRRVLMNTEGPVAFHAVIDGGPADTVYTAPGQRIKFDTDLVNLGGGYHNYSGTFIAPIAGVYIFSASELALNQHGESTNLSIKKNSVVYARLWASVGQGSASAVMQLAVGDEVWVEHDGGDAHENVHGNRITSFMGCLVVPM